MPASRRLPLLAWIAARPGRAFAAFLALHAAVWTALPALLYPNLPLDLIEALIYGREWQLGYDKLPPLPWWLVEVAYLTIGHDFAYYLLAQIAVVAGFAFVLLHRAGAGRPARRARCGADRRRPALPQLHLGQVQPRRRSSCRSGRWPALPSTARCAAGRTRIGCCSASPSAFRCGRNISSLVLAIPLALFVFTDRDARRTLGDARALYRDRRRARSPWRRIWSGW